MAPATAHLFPFNMGLFCTTHHANLPQTHASPFFEQGIMNLRSFSFHDVTIIMHPLLVLTPAIFALYYSYRPSIFIITFSLPFTTAGSAARSLDNVMHHSHPQCLHPTMVSMTPAFSSYYCSLYLCPM